MERLCGVDSLSVIYHRFSDGVEVVRCVLEFCKEVAEVERSYSSSIHRLLRSSAYTFHSNILMQWLGSEPFEEIGTLKHCWQKLGTELCKLADLHAEKADAYMDAMRKPLLALLPQLEETRKTLRSRMQQLRTTLETAQRKHSREKQKYIQMGDSAERQRERVSQLSQNSTAAASSRLKKMEARATILEGEFATQEDIYEEAHTALVEAHKTFNSELSELYRNTEAKELERVDTLKRALQEFTRIFSNTAPAYLESMQHIVMSVNEIDGSSDIRCFVEGHKELLTPPSPPELEKHRIRGTAGRPCQDDDSDVRREQREGSSPESITSEDNKPEPECASSHLASTKDNNTNVLEQSSIPVRPALPDKPPKTGRPTVGTDKRKEHSAVNDENVKPGDGMISKQQSLGSEGRTFQRRVQSEQGGNPGSSPDSKGSSPPPSHTAHLVTTQASSTATSIKRSVSGKGEKRQALAKPSPAPKPLSLSSSTSTEEGNLKPPETKHPANPQPSGSGRVDAYGGVTVTKQNPNSTTQLKERTGSGSKQPSKNNENGLHTKFKTQGPTRTASLGRYPHKLRTSVREEDGRTPSESGGRARSDSMTRPKVQERKRESEVPKDPDLLQLLSQLQECAAASDYYSLLGVDPSATGADLAKARREKSRELHPDHFGSDHEQRARAEEQLVRINQVFQDVLKNEETRVFYNQLCHFRLMYRRILDQGRHGLETAEGKLLALYRAVKKAQMPLALMEEIQLALKLIRTRLKMLDNS